MDIRRLNTRSGFCCLTAAFMVASQSRDQGSFLKTAPTKILTTEVVRICRAPGEEPFLGLFRSRAARWMRRAWARLATPRTAAFTAHVTIHVHEFSPQILP